MTNSYTADDIRKLEPMEQIQISPGMWIGPTDDPHHLVEEALDNALDEAQGGHVTIIAVKIDTKTNICSVMDNGRGIPISKDVPIIISTELFSGAKFQDKKSAYEIASGLHGVGLVCANALSDTYCVEIYRNKKHAIFRFENGKLIKKSIEEFLGEKPPFSTKIEFKPSKKIFESIIPDLNRIKKRLQIASAEMPKVTFALIVDSHKEIFKMTVNDYFEQRCIQGNIKIARTVFFKSTIKPESFNVIFSYTKNGSTAPKVLSSVNLLPVDNGGTHVNYLYEIVKDYFTGKAKKMGYVFQPQDCLVGLKAYIMLSLKEPKFGGQTKDRLTNPKIYLEKFATQIKNQLELHFNQNFKDENGEGELDKILNHFQSYRARLDANVIKTAPVGTRVSTKFTKLRDCSSKFGELFVAEGESAAGGLVDCRDPRKHAILPLKGKIPSAATAKDILKNKEIGELITSLGTGVGPNFNIDSLKYSKVICATDADDDGLHIFSLLTLALAILVPDVIKNGHYYYAETPLYAINEKNNFVPLWTNEDITNARNANKPLLRVKGLGEMNPDQLKVVLINEKTRRLIPITYSSNIDRMVKLFTDSEEKRKLLDGVWMI
ncbi:MAG: hypothetical protein KKH98_10985 [Spirochaetes bacterium]|nr:hypothetical protein [Spirochaetota bacterium]